MMQRASADYQMPRRAPPIAADKGYRRNYYIDIAQHYGNEYAADR